MIYWRRMQDMEMETLSLKTRVMTLEAIVETLMVAQVDHPDYEIQAKIAKGIIAAKGWRLAHNRKAVEDAQMLKDKLKTMAEDNPAVAEMLLKE